jgi:hypothetical protein
MINKVFRRKALRLPACTQNAPEGGSIRMQEPASLEKMRALATGAALAVDVDNSPAVLVSIQAYAQRYGDRPRRTA